jgi:hypothetical protein
MGIIFIFFKKIKLIALIGIIVIFFSCDKFDGDQTIPAYIQIDKFILDKNAILAEGSLSNKITDVWVYVDDELIGAFELPAKFPVLKKGKHTITLAPGIKMNGIASTRVEYPFYKKIYLYDFNLSEDSTSHIDTTLTKTSYREDTDFKWKEDFEDGGVSMQKRSGSDTNIIKTSITGNIFEGLYSGLIYLDQNQSFFEVETIHNYILPKNGSPVFLEMNYKSNNTVRVGLLAYFPTKIVQISTLVLYPSAEWKKIYINFTPDLSDLYAATDFKIFFGEYKSSENQTVSVLFDNIKLVHRKQ